MRRRPGAHDNTAGATLHIISICNLAIQVKGRFRNRQSR